MTDNPVSRCGQAPTSWVPEVINDDRGVTCFMQMEKKKLI